MKLAPVSRRVFVFLLGCLVVAVIYGNRNWVFVTLMYGAPQLCRDDPDGSWALAYRPKRWSWLPGREYIVDTGPCWACVESSHQLCWHGKVLTELHVEGYTIVEADAAGDHDAFPFQCECAASHHAVAWIQEARDEVCFRGMLPDTPLSSPTVVVFFFVGEVDTTRLVGAIQKTGVCEGPLGVENDVGVLTVGWRMRIGSVDRMRGISTLLLEVSVKMDMIYDGWGVADDTSIRRLGLWEEETD